MHLTGTYKPLLASAFLSALGFVTAVPQLAFPINSQVPPVAYASQPYKFVFSVTTFGSSAPQISYAITNGPKWLELDSASRQFSGVPDGRDVGATTFQLVASDTTGKTSTSVTFVVAGSQDLTVDSLILPQLGRSGPTSSPDSLFLHPQKSFSVAFDTSIFGGATSVTRYYAVSTDNTPLPSWVQFEDSELLFSGTSPALVSSLAGPQSYGLRLIASNVPGFTEAAVDFNLVISRRILAFSAAFQNISVSPGARFQSLSFRPLLTLDGQPVADDQVASVDANVPSWVALDRDQVSLSGTPSGSVNTTVIISATDIYGDTAVAMILLQSAGNRTVQLGSLATLNITAGEYFSYNLATPVFSPLIRAMAALGAASSWLNFDSKSWTLSGEVPLHQPPQTLDIVVTFENASMTVIGEVILHVLQNPGATAATSTLITKTQTFPQASTTSTASAPRTSDSNRDTNNGNVLHLILIVIFSVFGGCLALLLVLCYLRRKHRSRGSSKTSEEASAVVVEDQGPDLSRQIVPSDNALEGRPPRPITPRPLRVDLAWSNDSIRQSKQRISASDPPGPLSQHRMSQIFIEERDLLRQAEHRPALKGSVTPPFEHMLSTTELPKFPTPAFVVRPSTSGRQGQSRSSVRMSRQSILPPPIGLPDRRSGAGHGAGILGGPMDPMSSQMSWRNSWTTNGSTDPRRTTVVLQSFPAPPGEQSNPVRSLSRVQKPIPLLRIVSEDSDEAVSFEEQRQRWHTERARSRLEGASRFSNAGSARMPSPRTLRRVRSDDASVFHDLSMPTTKPGVPCGATREHSWSKWSGTTPAAQDTVKIRSVSGSVDENGAVLRSRPSIASSGQFESVASSDGQWEDENLVIEEMDRGGRRWQADSGSHASPRLPFSPVPASRENLSNDSGVAKGRQPSRIADGRKHVSVEEGGLKRSHGSQRGSLRFI